MLVALLGDLASFDDLIVSALWDNRAGPPPEISRVTWNRITPCSFLSQVAELAVGHDRTLIIAPETDGLLAGLVAACESAGAATANCAVDAIRQTTDKLALAQRLESAGVPTIPTRPASSVSPVVLPTGWSFPLVVKPRDGAGSQGVRRIDADSDWPTFPHDTLDIVQPWIAGQALSMAVLVPRNQAESPVCLAPARQYIRPDGSFTYEGGEVPASGFPVGVIASVAIAALSAVPGLAGYVGVDLVWPTGALGPLVCEINPRLTTSFVGYRELYGPALARALLLGTQFAPASTGAVVRFTPSGKATSVP